jgi:hypothetical protein
LAVEFLSTLLEKLKLLFAAAGARTLLKPPIELVLGF